ncbi:MAG: hypothetical protein GY710_10480 [Desulfobacteraceae bacterium]|nr:hypothetical protein [Desulfobacteraceae bacterium]
MNKQEIIIIGFAVVIGVYGLLDYFVFSPKNQKADDMQMAQAITKLDAFADSAGSKLVKVNSKNKSRDTKYLILKAESRWENDPFSSFNGPKTGEQRSNEPKTSQGISYTGFIKAGNKILAVINGMEYIRGESLKELGHQVTSITPSKVVLFTEANKEIFLQLEEN